MKKRLLPLILFAWVGLAQAGCTSFIAEKIAAAPNAGRTAEQITADPWDPDVEDIVIDERFRVPIKATADAAAVELDVWVIDANDQRLKETDDGLGLTPTDPKQVRKRIKPKGTVVLLHGFRHRKSKRVYLEWARLLASNGYRCVLIDNRGHGDSTGRAISFGVHESADAAKVIDALEDRGLVAKPLGVLGGSLGASAAIQLAAKDRRVDTVIAVAPFTRLDHVIESFAEGWAALAYLVPKRTWRRYARAVGDVSGVSIAQTDNIQAIGRARVPVLIIAGEADKHVPIKQAEALLSAAPPGSRLVGLPDQCHATLGKGVIKPIRKAALDWLAKEMVDRAATAKKTVRDTAPAGGKTR